MKEVMLNSDMAISAGGQTLYELARVGVPTIGVCIVKNQFKSIKKWGNSDFLEYAGWYNDDNILLKINKLLKKMEDVELRKFKSKLERNFLDGSGSMRVDYILLKKLY